MTRVSFDHNAKGGDFQPYNYVYVIIVIKAYQSVYEDHNVK